MSVSVVLKVLAVICFVLAALSIVVGTAGPLTLIAVGLALKTLGELA